MTQSDRPNANLEHLRKEAKSFLGRLRAGMFDAEMVKRCACTFASRG